MNFNRPDELKAYEVSRKADKVSHYRRVSSRLLWSLGFVSLIAAMLAFGAWNHAAQSREVASIARESRDMTPEVNVETVEPGDKIEAVSLPATTSAFVAANVFARASGYIGKREVDIGDKVKRGQLLAEIVAP